MHKLIRFLRTLFIAFTLSVSWLTFFLLAPAVLTKIGEFWPEVDFSIPNFSIAVPAPVIHMPPESVPRATATLTSPTNVALTPTPALPVVSVVCWVETFYPDVKANLRSGAGTGYAIPEQLIPGQTVNVIGQRAGADGYTWWKLENNLWVREDVVREIGDCQLAPFSE